MKEFFTEHGVKSVATSEGNMGCPHEEGEDFPEGEDCPFCPFWAGKQGSNSRDLRMPDDSRGGLHGGRGQTNPSRDHEPMDKIPDKLTLGKGSSFVKSRLSRLPRTDEVWEADIQPISVQGWDARRHGELWLGMVLTRLEDFHLALLAHEDAPTVNDLANLLAKAMERPWVMGARRPARILLRDNPQWQELIPHLRQLKIEVETQEELPLWDDAAAEYVRKLKATQVGRDVPIITVPQEFDEAFPAVVRWVKTQGRIEIGVEEGTRIRGPCPGRGWDGVRGQGRQVRGRGVDRPATEDRPGRLARQESEGSRLPPHNANPLGAVEAERRGRWPEAPIW